MNILFNLSVTAKRKSKGGRWKAFLPPTKNMNDCYAKNYTGHERYLQVVYLAKVKNEAVETISKITGYAISTIRNYIYKFADLLEEAKAFFSEVVKKVKRTRTQTITENTLMFGDVQIDYLNDTHLVDTPRSEKFYFFKFYDNENSQTPLFDKIGTTSKNCLERLKQEIRYYNNKNGFGIVRVEICAIWDCGEVPAESYESFLRALLIKKYPNTWHKNDRFFGTNIPVETFTKLCKQYAEI